MTNKYIIPSPGADFVQQPGEWGYITKDSASILRMIPAPASFEKVAGQFDSAKLMTQLNGTDAFVLRGTEGNRRYQLMHFIVVNPADTANKVAIFMMSVEAGDLTLMFTGRMPVVRRTELVAAYKASALKTTIEE